MAPAVWLPKTHRLAEEGTVFLALPGNEENLGTEIKYTLQGKPSHPFLETRTRGRGWGVRERVQFPPTEQQTVFL